MADDNGPVLVTCEKYRAHAGEVRAMMKGATAVLVDSDKHIRKERT